jgi:hypothetical protein
LKIRVSILPLILCLGFVSLTQAQTTPSASVDEKVKLPITGMWKTSSRFSVDLEEGEIVVKPSGGNIPELN